MNTIKLVISVFILGLIVSVTSCKKDTEEEETTTTTEVTNETTNETTTGTPTTTGAGTTGTTGTTTLGDEIRAKIGGVEKSFTYSGTNTHHYDTDYPGSPTGKLIQAGKAKEGATLPEIFAIDIFKDLDLMSIPTTYIVTPADIEDTTVDALALLTYTSGTTIYTSQLPGGNVSCTVTSKTNDLIEGTFSGKLFGNIIDFSNPFNIIMDSIQVTDGQFKVQLIRESID
jgi:hypothetical protein